MVTRPNWMAPFHIALGTGGSSLAGAPNGISGPATITGSETVAPRCKRAHPRSRAGGGSAYLSVTNASTSTRGWPAVPATSMLIVCVPLVAQPRDHAIRRASYEVAYRLIVPT